MKLENLVRIRNEFGFTHDEMSKMLGISKAFYCQIENQKRRLNYPMAVKISSIFKMTPDEIFFKEISSQLKKN